MQISVSDPVFQTILFTAILLAVVFLTVKKGPAGDTLQHTHTNELKGLAILMVIFSHAGYFLSTDTRFLYPLSVAGGVGVNLFLFLSGFGLTTSSQKYKLPLIKFYIKRLNKLYLPMWIILTFLLVSDYLLLGRSFNQDVIIKSFLGFFLKADIFTSLNSPLWYFSLILFYYLIFPIFFSKKWPLLSVALILILSIIVVNLKLPVDKDVLKLYQLHNLAFPLGMVLAVLLGSSHKFNFLKKIFGIISVSTKGKTFLKVIITLSLTALTFYLAIHSGVGEGIKKEQLISLITLVSLVLIAMLKKYQSGLLILLGTYSYEIYLIQWPLVYRYDYLYKNLPPFLATLLYLGFYIILGLALRRLVKLISLFFKSRNFLLN